MKKLIRMLFASVLVSAGIQCSTPPAKNPVEISLINTSHLDHLYDELLMEEYTVGIVHIYSEYPDYLHVGDEDEGIACVDDATRAAIFYLRHYQRTSVPEYLRKGKMLVRFILAMQSPNGYYYNFIWPDGTINKEGSTSQPEPNFWSWRVLWAFGEVYEILQSDPSMVSQINMQRETLIEKILSTPEFKSGTTDTTQGITFPTWLPKVSGSDQAAILLAGMSFMLQQQVSLPSSTKKEMISFMKHQAEGITLMQVEQPDSLHDGAFLSWENLWHAYANIQSYALLVTGETLEDPHLISHAFYEVDRFYPAFLRSGGLEHFFVKTKGGRITRYDTQAYPQIAYGRRPMIWAALKAYRMTKEKKYLSMAMELASWFHGHNAGNITMYDPGTGRGYDGLMGPGTYNKNAGAESTIEALLAIQELERND